MRKNKRLTTEKHILSFLAKNKVKKYSAVTEKNEDYGKMFLHDDSIVLVNESILFELRDSGCIKLAEYVVVGYYYVCSITTKGRDRMSQLRDKTKTIQNIYRILGIVSLVTTPVLMIGLILVWLFIGT